MTEIIDFEEQLRRRFEKARRRADAIKRRMVDEKNNPTVIGIVIDDDECQPVIECFTLREAISIVTAEITGEWQEASEILAPARDTYEFIARCREEYEANNNK
jgi:hypothetical protein